jgi:hypothetical protein
VRKLAPGSKRRIKTRYVVAGGFVPSRQAVFVEEMLKRAIARCGLPRALYVAGYTE